jgi:quaternary ammonium compound-resistance protein SugE
MSVPQRSIAALLPMHNRNNDRRPSCKGAFYIARATTQVSSWILLVFAGLLEIGWAIGVNMLRFYHLLTIRIYGCRYGTNHVFARFGGEKTTNANGRCGSDRTEIWVGGTASMGILILKESRYWPRLIWIGLIAGGVLGLKLVKEQLRQKF